jgi:hypothetical protein
MYDHLHRSGVVSPAWRLQLAFTGKSRAKKSPGTQQSARAFTDVLTRYGGEGVPLPLAVHVLDRQVESTIFRLLQANIAFSL